jgi:hypothetical protein
MGLNYFKFGQSGSGVKITSDRELFTTNTVRESDVFTFLSATLSDGYIIFASLLNNDYPHRKIGQAGPRIDITNIYMILDISAAGEGIIEMGVVTRIDAINADIEYFLKLPFLGGASKTLLVQQFNGNDSQLKTAVQDGTLLYAITNNKEAEVTAVNTGTALPSPAGDIAPNQGDIIMKVSGISGVTNVNIGMSYHNSD